MPTLGVAVALSLASFCLQSVFALSPVTVKGSKFFNADGSQFYIKGIAYQLTNDDPLVDTSQCQLDIALMKTLGTNTIRVYHVDASANHDGCMSAFADAGIYTLIDLDTFNTYIIPPASTTPRWTNQQYDAYKAVMDTFQGYDNVLGFFVGNEMITTNVTSPGAPYVKAAARDMKAYRDSKGYRQIPIGYSAADVAQLRPNLQNYLACGGDAADALDFYSSNVYEWCGDSSYQVSGYDILEANATGYPIPIFFSEDGCITVPPRTFEDQTAILGPDMDNTWSGAIIYEWAQEVNNYGLVSYGPSLATTATGGFVLSGTPTAILPDFTDLSSQWATLNPTGVSSDAYTPAGTTPVCPPFTSGQWSVSGNVPLPTLGESYKQQSQAAHTSQQTSGTAGTTTTTTGSGSGSMSTSPGATTLSSGSKSSASSFGISTITMSAAAAFAILILAVAL